MVDLPLDRAVLDLTLTSQSTDGSLSDTVSPDRRTVTLASDVLFAFGSADLTPDAATRLTEAAAAARGSGSTASIDGYTDAVGDPATNLDLSERRATAVLNVLRPQLPGLAFTVRGHGEADPVAANTNTDGSDNVSGRIANRRVTLTIAA